MDFFNQIVEFAKANPIVLLLAYFLFKDKIDPLFSFLNKKPVVPVVPVAPADPVAPAVPVTEPADKPVIEAILKLLPVVLPVILAQIEKSKKE